MALPAPLGPGVVQRAATWAANELVENGIMLGFKGHIRLIDLPLDRL
jgi:hypothetical protein